MTDGETKEETLAMLEVEEELMLEEAETIPGAASAEKMGISLGIVQTNHQEIINVEIARRRAILHLNVLNPKNVVGVALKIT